MSVREPVVEQAQRVSEPYIGLRPFDREDSSVFFGRDRLVRQLLARLRTTRFIGVLGLSGEGKSSLVRAGLIPALDSGHLDWDGAGWTVVTLTPGVNPLEALATALNDSAWGKDYAKRPEREPLLQALRRRPGALTDIVREVAARDSNRLLIVVDQFEELFTRDDKRDAAAKREARFFVDQLLDASTRSTGIYVLATMRSEFLGQCAEYSDLAEAITRGVFLVTRMRANELAEAIEMPARLHFGDVEPELTRHLIDQLKGEVTLPVLQHLLMRMWRDEKKKENAEKDAPRTRSPTKERYTQRSKSEAGSRHGPRLTRDYLARFEKPGDALDHDLTEAYSGISGKFTPDQQRATEAIFRRITKQTGWNERKQRYEYARDPATVAEIARVGEVDEKDVYAVVEAFRESGRTFLKASDKVLRPESLIDLTHEAVINNWRGAQVWAADEAENARQFQQLREQAGRARDEDGKFSSESLLKGSDLEQKSDWFDNARVRSNGPRLSEQWAARYAQNADSTDVPSAEDSGSNDEFFLGFTETIAFLEESRAQGERANLWTAIQKGNIDQVADIVERGVRLTAKELTKSETADESSQSGGRWEFASHYWAAVPERANLAQDEGAETQQATSLEAEKSGEEAKTAPIKDEDWLEACFPKNHPLDNSALQGMKIQHYAAWGGDALVLETLKARGLPFDVPTERGLRPFDFALANGRLEAAKTIYGEAKRGASGVLGGAQALINSTNEKLGGANAVHLVVREWAKAVRRAERSLSKTSSATETSKRYQAVLNWLIVEQGADVDCQDHSGATPLHWTVIHDNPGALRMLLEKADIKLNVKDQLGRTPLFLAASEHKDGLVHALLERSADPTIADRDGITPLLACLLAGSDSYPTLDLLLGKLTHARDVNPFTNEGALHLVLDRADPSETVSLVVALVGKGARIDLRDDSGRTPVSIAVDKGREAIAGYLFRERKESGEGKEHYGDWMTQAVRANTRGFLRDMLSSVPASTPNSAGDTVLHVAADKGDTGALLDVFIYGDGYNVDAEDRAGLTPLRRALLAGNLECAKMLVGEDAEIPAYMAGTDVAPFADISTALKQRLSNSAGAEWEYAPMMPGDWKQLPAEEAAQALYQLFKSDPTFLAEMRAERIDAVRALAVGFFDGGKVYEARLAADGRALGYVLFVGHPSETIWLTGKAPWELLRHVSKTFDFSTQEKARDYLHFHAGANFWDRGVLAFVQSADDACVGASLPTDARARVAEIAAPIKLREGEGSKRWTGDAVVQYGEELWRITIDVRNDGVLSLGGESAGVDGLPFVSVTYKNGIRTHSLSQTGAAAAPPTEPPPPEAPPEAPPSET